MEDVFNTIGHIAKMKDRNKIYLEPNFKSVPQVAKELVQEVSIGKYPGKSQAIKHIMAPVIGYNIVLVSETGAVVSNTMPNPIETRVVISLIQAGGRWSAITVKGNITSRAVKVYQGQSQIQIKDNGPHHKIQKKLRQATKNGNILINKIASVLESTYLVKQTEQLLSLIDWR